MIVSSLVLYLLLITEFFPNVFSQHELPILPPPCDSKIYCESELLHDVQMARLYNDSKTFVDKKLKYPEHEILAKYRTLKSGHNGRAVPKNLLQTFVDSNMEDGNELVEWVPPDFVLHPKLENWVADPGYKKWVYGLNKVWKTLARKVKDDVRLHPELYSMIYVPHGFCIPGGRFRELYYWDTYWIVNGLMLCDMHDTARGVILNLIGLVDRNGFMPNGARKYYLNRSQPPLLIPMVANYFKATNDFQFVITNINPLEAEFNFWLDNRMVTIQKNGKSYRMAIYDVKSRGPRPESYREDFDAAQIFSTEREQNDFHCKMKSGAETGWDFSSRYFITPDGKNRGALPDIQTPYIVPVDLNSILHANAEVLSKWFLQMGDIEKANKYKTIAQELLSNIQEVMWVAERGCWFDWDRLNHKHRDYFYPSNVTPLWTGSYSMPKETAAKSVLRYLKNLFIIEEDNSVRYQGTPTSLFVSGNQWDMPNGWAPLQAFIIQGLDRTQDPEAMEVAKNLANVWLRSNYKGFLEKDAMYEKYDVLAAGETGGGGEYDPQTGFGWTNGLALELLHRWPELTPYDIPSPTANQTMITT